MTDHNILARVHLYIYGGVCALMKCLIDEGKKIRWCLFHHIIFLRIYMIRNVISGFSKKKLFSVIFKKAYLVIF